MASSSKAYKAVPKDDIESADVKTATAEHVIEAKVVEEEHPGQCNRTTKILLVLLASFGLLAFGHMYFCHYQHHHQGGMWAESSRVSWAFLRYFVS